VFAVKAWREGNNHQSGDVLLLSLGVCFCYSLTFQLQIHSTSRVRQHTLWKAVYTGRLFAGAEWGSEEWPFKSALALNFLFSSLPTLLFCCALPSVRDSAELKEERL
jgi:hypothetical protein